MLHDLFNEFPNLHPLLVHFPVVLLLLAALAQVIILFYPAENKLKSATFFLMSAGCISAYISVQTGVHISGDVDEKAIDVFETHHLFGQFALWSSLVATALRFITLKWLKKKWMEFIIAAVIFSTAAFVTIAGHQGAQLVYIYNVGPGGNGVLPK